MVTADDNNHAIIVQTSSTDAIHIENEEENVRKRSYLSSLDPSWDPTPKRPKLDELQSLEIRRKQFILSVSAFKCRLCSFLALTMEDVEKHLFKEHEDEYLDDGEMWFEIAKKEKIPLQCEHCDNSFMSMVDFRIWLSLLDGYFSNLVLQGTRSYVAHAMDDHGLNTDDAMISYEKQNLVRRRKVLCIINDQAEIKKIK